jgi:hypothetical protein
MNRLLSNLSFLLGKICGSGRVNRPRPRPRLQLEALEDRLSPSTLLPVQFPTDPCFGAGLYFPHNPG